MPEAQLSIGPGKKFNFGPKSDNVLYSAGIWLNYIIDSVILLSQLDKSAGAPISARSSAGAPISARQSDNK